MTTTPLSGKGTLTTTMSFKGKILWPISFSGNGALSIAFHQKCPDAAILGGHGALTTTPAQKFAVAAALKGSGALAATAAVVGEQWTTTEPSGQAVYSPKIKDQALVRKFISQGSRGYTAISITDGANSIDPDSGSLNLAVYFNDVTALFPPAVPGFQIVNVGSSAITRTDLGHYYYDIGPPNTAYRGILTMVWTYTVNGVPFAFTDYAQILNPMPLYETLSDAEKSIIEQVSWMIGDIFDSTEGGPNLIEPFQTHFDYERIAQMMRISVTRMNLIGFPVEYWGVGPDAQSVPPTFQGLTVIGTYLEVMRHMIASYTEIPLFQGMNVTYADRRDYAQRWQSIFSAEWPEYLTYVKMAKRSLLNLARGALLVGGGIYGGNALGIFQAGTYACLQGLTQVVTGDGIKAIQDLVGIGEIKVLGKDNTWTSAEIRSFGRQKLYRLTLSRGTETQDILVTAEHRWFRPDLNEITTVSLVLGQHLCTMNGPEWVVASVDPTDKIDEVFCAIVPDGNAFMLAGDLLTGNSQVRSWRFYPAAPAISWGASSHGAGFPGGL